MGGDHTVEYTVAPEIVGVGKNENPLETNKADLSRKFLDVTAFIDSSGYCLFIIFAILYIPEGFEGVLNIINSVMGTN
jgi:aldehyde:ferredoxin oxidoreductase